MSKRKQPPVPKKNEVSIVRSSTAEYLTFVAVDGKGYQAKHYSLQVVI